MHALNANNRNDQDLVRQVLCGDTRAFAAIVRNTEALVAQIVFRMIKNDEDRKDLAQEIYLKAYRYLPGFRFDAKLSTWIAQIAYNTCINYLQKKRLLLPGEPEDTALPENEATAASLSRKQLATILRHQLEKLPPVYQTLISLYHQQDCSYNEITRITGLPEGTVKNYLFRARKALRDNLLLQYKKEEL